MNILKKLFKPKKRKYQMRHENGITDTTWCVCDGDGTVWAHVVPEHPFVFKCDNNIALKRSTEMHFFFNKVVGINHPELKTYQYVKP